MFTSIINLGVMDGVPNANLFDYMFLLVNFGKVLCSSANELQQNSNGFSREEYIPEKGLFFNRFIAFTFQLCGFLSFVCHL